MNIQVVSVGPAQLDALGVVLEAIERETGEEAGAAERAAQGLVQARASLVYTGAFWVLLALVEGAPAGYAAVCRIPKLDARAGFLFVDELYVLAPYRRQGVATALLDHTCRLARELGLAGVRLLVRPDNVAARRLYRAVGFTESPSLFCEHSLTRW